MKEKRIVITSLIVLSIFLCTITFNISKIEKERNTLNISYENDKNVVEAWNNKEEHSDLLNYLSSVTGLKVGNVSCDDSMNTIVELSYKGNINDFYKTMDELKNYSNIDSLENINFSKNKDEVIVNFNIKVKSI